MFPFSLKGCRVEQGACTACTLTSPSVVCRVMVITPRPSWESGGRGILQSKHFSSTALRPGRVARISIPMIYASGTSALSCMVCFLLRSYFSVVASIFHIYLGLFLGDHLRKAPRLGLESFQELMEVVVVPVQQLLHFGWLAFIPGIHGSNGEYNLPDLVDSIVGIPGSLVFHMPPMLVIRGIEYFTIVVVTEAAVEDIDATFIGMRLQTAHKVRLAIGQGYKPDAQWWVRRVKCDHCISSLETNSGSPVISLVPWMTNWNMASNRCTSFRMAWGVSSGNG